MKGYLRHLPRGVITAVPSPGRLSGLFCSTPTPTPGALASGCLQICGPEACHDLTRAWETRLGPP